MAARIDSSIEQELLVHISLKWLDSYLNTFAEAIEIWSLWWYL
jgi:hypothetical protein